MSDTVTNAQGCGECKGATIGCNAIVGCYSCALYLHAREIEELKTKIPVTVISRAEYARLVETLEQASNFLNILEIQYELRKNGDLRFNSAVIDFEDLTRAASIKSLCDAALKAAREGGKS